MEEIGGVQRQPRRTYKTSDYRQLGGYNVMSNLRHINIVYQAKRARDIIEKSDYVSFSKL